MKFNIWCSDKMHTFTFAPFLSFFSVHIFFSLILVNIRLYKSVCCRRASLQFVDEFGTKQSHFRRRQCESGHIYESNNNKEKCIEILWTWRNKFDDVMWERKKEEENIKLVSHTHEYLNNKKNVALSPWLEKETGSCIDCVWLI